MTGDEMNKMLGSMSAGMVTATGSLSDDEYSRLAKKQRSLQNYRLVKRQFAGNFNLEAITSAAEKREVAGTMPSIRLDVE